MLQASRFRLRLFLLKMFSWSSSYCSLVNSDYGSFMLNCCWFFWTLLLLRLLYFSFGSVKFMFELFRLKLRLCKGFLPDSCVSILYFEFKVIISLECWFCLTCSSLIFWLIHFWLFSYSTNLFLFMKLSELLFVVKFSKFSNLFSSISIFC